MANQSSRDRAFLKKLREIVEENFADEKFGVDDLAHEAGLSRSQIHRKLHELTNQSTSQFIREIRLEHAREMLQDDIATVSEIAYRVGFSSPTYFSKCFHEYYGFPPGEAVHAEPDEENKHPPDSETSKSDSTTNYRNLLYATIALVLLVLLGGGYYYYQNGWETEARVEESIAVLPLHNLTGDPDQAFFVDGLHDALIGELGQLSKLRVISRTSTLQFRDTESATREIADRLGVNNIIEGSVYGAGDSVRIQLQLIQVNPEEHHIWAENYDRNTADILSLLSEVTRNVAQSVQVSLTPEEETHLASTRTVNPETYKAYLRGMYYLGKSTEAGRQKGLAYMHQAVDNDPADPLAYAGLALGYIDIAHNTPTRQDALIKAKAAARRAFQLDSTLVELHAALGEIYVYNDWNWEAAEKTFKYVNKLNPSMANNHYHYAWYLHLIGRKEEALAEHELAARLDPFSPKNTAWLAWLYACYGKFQKAETEIRKAQALDSSFHGTFWARGLIYEQQEKYDEAIKVYTQLVEQYPRYSWLLGCAYAKAGHTIEARRLLHELEQEPLTPWNARGIAGIYACLGENDEAFKWLTYPFDPPLPILPWFRANINFSSLHDDPRFNALLAEMNLPPVSIPSEVSP